MSAPTSPAPEPLPGKANSESAPAEPPLEQVRRTSDYDRRTDARYRTGQNTKNIEVRLEAGETCSVRILDISAGGLALEADRRLEVTSLLSIEVPTKDEFGTTRLVVRVASVAPQAGGTWKIGCTFARKLSPSELLAIL
jgi:hypothetical protein